MEFGYAAVERALASYFAVPRKEMKAFRARLRHLRNKGVAKLPNPGRGQHLAFSQAQVAEIAVALQLGMLGIAPVTAVFAAAVGKAEIVLSEHGHRADAFLAILDGPRVEFAANSRELSILVEHEVGYVVISLARLVDAVGRELRRAVT